MWLDVDAAWGMLDLDNCLYCASALRRGAARRDDSTILAYTSLAVVVGARLSAIAAGRFFGARPSTSAGCCRRHRRDVVRHRVYRLAQRDVGAAVLVGCDCAGAFARFQYSALLCFVRGVKVYFCVFFFFQRAVVDAVGNLLQWLFRGVQQALTSSLVGALLMAQLFDSAECVDVVAHDDAVAIADVAALANGDATRDVSLVVVVVSALAFALLVSLIACFYLCVLQKRKRDRDVEQGSSRPPPPTAAASATASTARGSTDEDVDDKAPSNANT